MVIGIEVSIKRWISNASNVPTQMCKILIVEDERKLAAFVDKGLRKYGFSTALAADGAQALEASKKRCYDAILLDIGLPVKDGWAVLRELRERGDESPVIVMTAMSDLREEAIAAKANDYLQKPFRVKELLNAITKQTEPCSYPSCSYP